MESSTQKECLCKIPAGQLFFYANGLLGRYPDHALNTDLMRFADVLLMDAECEVEIGSLDQAEVYVNMVRNRAANPAGWVY